MRILYLDCISGISGDMTIGALLDLGADPEFLKSELEKLHFSTEYDLSWNKVVKNGIAATKFDVIKKRDADPSETHHPHRHLSAISQMIIQANYKEHVTEMAINVFQAIGRAEAKIHNKSLESIHFHEVGAVDSIIDIVGTALLLDSLNVERVIASSVPVGSGKIKIAHGIYPVPAPATLELLKGVPIQSTTLKGELTTPTGAGFMAELVDEFGPLPSMTVEAIGYGAGTKTFPDHPNVLRAILGSI